MTTAIKGCYNKSSSTVSIINQENKGDDALVYANSENDSVYAWISQHRDRPLTINTRRGLCRIWDSDWKIHGCWDHDGSEFIFTETGGGDYFVTIEDDGNINLRRL